jgi:hypothetical protein
MHRVRQAEFIHDLASCEMICGRRDALVAFDRLVKQVGVLSPFHAATPPGLTRLMP